MQFILLRVFLAFGVCRLVFFLLTLGSFQSLFLQIFFLSFSFSGALIMHVLVSLMVSLLSLILRFYSCLANSFICTIFLDSTYMHSYMVFIFLLLSLSYCISIVALWGKKLYWATSLCRVLCQAQRIKKVMKRT